MAFTAPVNIGNRALQHCGSARMDVTLGFTEDSTNAAEVAACYDGLRRAELRRNTWRFAIKKAVLRPLDTTTMFLAASLWASGTTYFVGSIVADAAGTLWISQIPNNLGLDPTVSTAWQEYFGPLTVTLYAATTSYYAGELVYTAAGDGTNRVFLSLQNANADNPATATAYDSTATYAKNQTVTFNAVAYQSLIDLNTGNEPDLAPALWASGTTYGAAAKVGASDGVIYSSIAGGNLAHDPTTDAGVHWTNTGVLNPWTSVFVGGAGSLKWLEVGGKEFPAGVTLTTLAIPNLYPLGAGPSSQTATLNAYRLPAGYLRTAPQDPKAGASSALGAPSGRAYDDWNYEGNYIVSAGDAALVLRFVADTVDVTAFDDMFCEGLACRVAIAVAPRLTQSTAKKDDIEADYNKFMGEARTINGIETGAEEPPLDDYIACRA